MKRLRSIVVGLALALLLALAAGGCGGDGGGTEPAETPAEMADHDDEMDVLHIRLSEWSITGEKGAPVPEARAGEVALEVHNDGEMPHELAVIRTDAGPAELPVTGGVVGEEAAGELLGRTSQISAGDIEVLALELDAGAYALICNIAAHYEQGMSAQLVVKE
jgi:uncharacterized cupredoxin-like copper-binding protein